MVRNKSIPSQSHKKLAREIQPGIAARRFGDSKIWLLGFGLLAIVLSAYFPALRYPFVSYDDVDYVTQNVHVRDGVSWDLLSWAITSTEEANWHPVTWVSHALDCDLYGLNAGGHHFTSILLHAVNAVLIFLLLWRATRAVWKSWMVAAIFALHPINVESVAWIAERKTVLSMFFFLLTLGAYGWFVRKPGVRRFALVCILFVLALAAKPMVVTLPFCLLLLDVWPLGRWSGAARSSLSQHSMRSLGLEKMPLFALSLASSVITLIAQRPAMKTMDAIPFGQRMANAIYSYVAYLEKAFWPVRLSVFYAPQGGRLAGWQVLLCALVLVAVSALIWRTRSRAYILVGWLWFLGTLVPMIGLVQAGQQGMADRYAYLPLLGIFVIVIWEASELGTGKIPISVYATVGGVVLVLLTYQTERQVRTWQNTLAMWTHSLEITPENFVAEDSVGTILMQEGQQATGKSCVDEALRHFQRAVQVYPQDALGLLNVGFCKQSRGLYPLAITEYTAALQVARTRYLKSRAFLNLGAAYDDQGILTEAKQYFEQGLALAPRDPQLQNAMAKVQAEERVIELREAVVARPTADAYLEMGRLQMELGRNEDAKASFKNALRLDPTSQRAQAGLTELNRKVVQ